jgi:hypothetical protein
VRCALLDLQRGAGFWRLDCYFGHAMIERFVCHSRRVLKLAAKFGWKPGARYTNLRDVRDFRQLGLLDINWRRYSFLHHCQAAELSRPQLTVARDIVRASQLSQVLREADALMKWCQRVVVVPKTRTLAKDLARRIPNHFILGFSVPTLYGATSIAPDHFEDRPVHLLGGRPDIQLSLAKMLNVVSLDCNRFTLDAAYGDYFDGERFRPHPSGGYDRCIRDSLKNINRLWRKYDSGFKSIAR